MSEVVFLTATVQRLDEEIAQLNKTRAALLRRLNALSPISRSLPPETLALIFQHAAAASHDFAASAPRKPPRCSPLLIGAVCSFWRQIAWSTPILWTYTDPVPIRRNAQVSDAHLLRLYFANARALPVHIQIKLDRLSSSPSAASEEILRAVFIENSHNIGTLICTSKSSLRQRWAMLAPKLTHAQFPHLKKVEINLRGAPLLRYDEPMFVNAPALTRVSFVGYHLPHETLNFWEQITVLELSALPVSQCLETLVKCTRLQEFRCTSPRAPQRSVDVVMNPSTPVVSLEHLTKFEWVGALSEWDVFLYTYVRLPKLQHLVLGHSHPLSRPLDAPPGTNNVPTADQSPLTTDPLLWKSFLLHIKSLSILELPVFHSAQEWLDIFSIFGPTLHTLKFTAFRDAEETLKVLKALQFTYALESDAEVKGDKEKVEGRKDLTNCLPNLKTMHATLDLHPDRARVVLDMLCSRRIRPLVVTSPLSSSSPTTTSSSSTTITSNTPSASSPSTPSDSSDAAGTESSTSTTASSSSSSLPSTSLSGSLKRLRSLEDKQWRVNPNDYLGDETVDYEVWSGDTTSSSLSTSVSSFSSFTSTFSPASVLSSSSTSTSSSSMPPASSSTSTSAPSASSSSSSSTTSPPASVSTSLPSAAPKPLLDGNETQDDPATPTLRLVSDMDHVPTSIHITSLPPSQDTSSSSSTTTISTPQTAMTTTINTKSPNSSDSQGQKTKKQKTRLEQATIKCWPFGFEFGERERKVCELLRKSGMVLDVVGGER